MKSYAVLKYSIPTFLLLFCWLTMGVTAAYDNDLVTTYGFPLNWYAPSIVSSGGYEIALGPLIIDLALFGFLAHLTWTALRNRLPFATVPDRIVKGLLWSGAALSLFVSIAAFSIDPHLTWWTLSPAPPETAPKTRFLSIGLQPRPSRPSHK